jgi:hypothetical protein
MDHTRYVSIGLLVHGAGQSGVGHTDCSEYACFHSACPTGIPWSMELGGVIYASGVANVVLVTSLYIEQCRADRPLPSRPNALCLMISGDYSDNEPVGHRPVTIHAYEGEWRGCQLGDRIMIAHQTSSGYFSIAVSCLC